MCVLCVMKKGITSFFDPWERGVGNQCVRALFWFPVNFCGFSGEIRTWNLLIPATGIENREL